MLSYLIDLLFLIVTVWVAYLVSRQAMVHAATSFVAVLIASLIAITTFESVATWAGKIYLNKSDIVAEIHLYFFFCVGIFAAALTMLMWLTNLVLPIVPEMSQKTEKIGRWVFSGLTGYLFASFLLTAVLTFPAPREYWGALAPEAQRRPSPIMRLGPDYQFLALTEYTCENAFAVNGGALLLDRHIMSAQAAGGRWSSFPIRYARWREAYEWRWRRFDVD